MNAASDVALLHTVPDDPRLHMDWPKKVLFISVVEGLAFHRRFAEKYRNDVATAGAKGQRAPTKESVLQKMRPDPIDRELAANAASWLKVLYGNSMGRKYTDAPDPVINALPSVAQMRDALVRRELAAAPFRRDGARDVNLVLDLQAGMRQQGPRSPAVTINNKAQAFLDSL